MVYFGVESLFTDFPIQRIFKIKLNRIYNVQLDMFIKKGKCLTTKISEKLEIFSYLKSSF